MSGCYPAGVTGFEPEISGTGLEGKCEDCIETGAPSNAIEDGVVEADGRLLCWTCLSEHMKESAGISLHDLIEAIKIEVFKNG